MSAIRWGRLTGLVVVIISLGGGMAYLAQSAFTPLDSSGGPSTIPPASTTPTTAVPVAQLIRGVGEVTTSVTEGGKVMCPPGHGCVERQYQLDTFYPARQASPLPSPGVAVAKPLSPYPLVVFGAGFDTMPTTYLPLIDAWVRAGFVVAAPVFPLTSSAALTSYGVNLLDTSLADQYEDDVVNQPQDMSAAITEVTDMASQASSPLFNEVNLGQVAVAGQSDGADTVLALTNNTCCFDSRIKAALVLSGAEFPGFTTPYFTTAPIPTLVTQGTLDTVNPQALSNQIYSGAQPPKVYVSLLGANHLSPYTEVDPYEAVVAKVSVSFLDGYLKQGSLSPSQIQQAGNVPGVSQVQMAL